MSAWPAFTQAAGNFSAPPTPSQAPPTKANSGAWDVFTQAAGSPDAAIPSNPEQAAVQQYNEQMKKGSTGQQGLVDLTKGNFAKGAHEVVSQIGEDLLPLAAPALVQAPAATLVGAVGSYGGQKLGEFAAREAGAGEDVQNLAGDVGAIAGGIGGAKVGDIAAKAIPKMIPSAERAGEAMGVLRRDIGEHPVEITDDLSKSLSRYQELVDNGNSGSVPVNKLLKRVTDPEKGDLTYNEARDFTTKLGELTSDERAKISPTMQRQIADVRAALKDSTAQTAGRAGKLDRFVQSNKEYQSAKKLEAAKDWIKDMSVKGLKGAGWAGGATGAIYELRKLLGE